MLKEVEELRKEIDSLDDSLIKLLEERLEIVKKIKDIKNKNELPIEDLEREKEILNKTNNEVVKELLKIIIEYGKNQ